MIIRKLRPNERYKGALVSAAAFEGGTDYLRQKQECEAMTAEEIAAAEKMPPLPENPLPSDHFRSETWAAFDDNDQDEKAFSVVSIIPYTVRFDGHTTLMGGVGGVATLPPYRRGGAVRECVRAALDDMNQNGFDFSFLYPFSRAYYRKFGYENGGSVRVYDIKFSGLRKYPAGGTVEMLLPGDDYSVLADIYNQFYENYNLSVVRRRYDRDLEEANTLEQRRYIYVWKNDAGVPRGFMIFTNEHGSGVMNCVATFPSRNGFIFLDMEAFMGLMNFAQTFQPNYHAIRIAVPEPIRLDSVIHENNNVDCRVENNGMARVVSVGRVLSMCRCKGSGQLKIGISDPLAPWNNGTWKITYSPNMENAVEKTEEYADIELDINAFTSLICGIMTADDLPYIPNVRKINPDAAYDNVFHRKNNHVLDLF